MEKICWQITVAAFMQPLQYDLRSRAAKDNSITNAATARSNLDAAITMRSAETELQNTIELRATASEIVAPKPGSRRQSEKKTILKHFLKGFLEGKSLVPKWRKSADKSLSQPSCSHSKTISEIQLQKTIVLRMQPQHEATLTQPLQCDLQRLSCKPQSHLHCGNDPTVAKQNGIPSATHPPATLAIPFTFAGTILQLQIATEFHRQLIHQHHLQPHLQCGNDPTVANHNGILSTAHARKTVETAFTMQNRSEHDPNMIRPHTRPSRNRRTAEVDHRGSGTDFVWKNIGFRASAISQKRISCETSFKTPSATHPPAPLATPFTMRERSYSCKSQWNSVDRTCTKNSWNPIYNAEPIRAWSEHDPTTHETVSQPSHRRGRSSRFGDGLCMEKHRVSCICYLSKTHFVRDFLQNYIGNSSTSTTCNAILTLSLTSFFPDSLKVTINSVPN